ncbi:hypothetical protein AC230_29485 [Streptomyces caatingaensis]|uniref:Uncharacterized protein n=2 Tax=Streptomyces caatingaensis TaxID=1678637 RepID=A0A0K9X817_9ACTN|nr:hypothetical protein AC230_29485 [Streptomyces caatingaensis]
MDRAFNPDRYDADGQLVLASAEGGGGGGTHKATSGPWTTASGVAGELHRDMQTAMTDLGHAHEGLGNGTSGFASAKALGALRPGWEERLSGIRDLCGHLDGEMKKVGVEFHENEVGTKKSFK